MKKLLYALILMLISSCRFVKENERIPVLKSNNGKLTFVFDNDTTHVNWADLPKRHVYSSTIECPKTINPIVIVTDTDTFSSTISPNDTIKLQLDLADQAPEILEFVGIYKNAKFSDQYILEHKGKIIIEIPEVHELANILIAISKIGRKDGNMVNLETEYHQEVLDHFLPFANHSIMDTINKYIVDRGTESYWRYYALKMNACGYIYNENEEIINKGIIRKMGFPNQADPFVKNTQLIEDFARKTHFRKFFKEHLPYYDRLIENYKELNPINQMQNWLENKFDTKYDNYTIYFSPLVGGAHSTSRFSDNGFNQIVMFVSMAEYDHNHNANINEMRNSRVVFTEIDHNFLDLTSKKYRDTIYKAFSNRKKWTNEKANQGAYTSPISVFSEYMTWGLFSLYCLDSYPEEDAIRFISTMEDQMVLGREFIEFRKFNQELIRIQMENRDISANRLLDNIAKWCMNQ